MKSPEILWVELCLEKTVYRFHSAELSGQLTFTQLFELPSEGHSEAKSRKLIWLKENKQKNNKHSISPKCSTVYIWILDLSVCCPDFFSVPTCTNLRRPNLWKGKQNLPHSRTTRMVHRTLRSVQFSPCLDCNKALKGNNTIDSLKLIMCIKNLTF